MTFGVLIFSSFYLISTATRRNGSISSHDAKCDSLHFLGLTVKVNHLRLADLNIPYSASYNQGEGFSYDLIAFQGHPAYPLQGKVEKYFKTWEIKYEVNKLYFFIKYMNLIYVKPSKSPI